MNQPTTTRTYQTHGKWILAGEHSVLRGHPALSFPLLDRSVTLHFTPSNAPFSCEVSGTSEGLLQILLEDVLTLALQRIGQPWHRLNGHASVVNRLPIGMGMGFSAALSVLIQRWFEDLGWLNPNEGFDFARWLEDHFHGQSSGLDIASVGSSEPLRYVRDTPPRTVQTTWQPHWVLTHTGSQYATAACVERVDNLWEASPEHAKCIDQSMSQAVDLAFQSITSTSHPHPTASLARAINQARACFDAWGLVSPAMTQHMEALKHQGALATKPTGAGLGGYVLSLWDHPVDSLVSVDGTRLPMVIL